MGRGSRILDRSRSAATASFLRHFSSKGKLQKGSLFNAHRSNKKPNVEVMSHCARRQARGPSFSSSKARQNGESEFSWLARTASPVPQTREPS
jgi:hypothetical protein